jgi:hypothetical protein
MRSFFALAANAGSPNRFVVDPQYTSPLLAINDIWEEVNRMQATLLLMRVRSESSVGERLRPGDQIESVIGLIDSSVRWRMAATSVRIAIQSIRTPGLAGVCFAALGALVSKHQASFTIQEKQGIAASIRNEIDKLADDKTRQSLYECEVAQMLLRFVFADNEYEATSMLPYLSIYMLNRMDGDEEGAIRTMTMGTVYSAMLLVDSFNRLNERLPEWMYWTMPVMDSTPKSASPADTPKPPVEAPAKTTQAPKSVHDDNDEP